MTVRSTFHSDFRSINFHPYTLTKLKIVEIRFFFEDLEALKTKWNWYGHSLRSNLGLKLTQDIRKE